MGQTRHREGGESTAGAAGDSDYIPSFELIPLEDGSDPDAALFDFGPDLDRPAGAPVAVLPPWMDSSEETSEQNEELGPRRARRRAAQTVPRARRHRRPEEEPAAEVAPALPVQPQAEVRLFDEADDAGSTEDTRDVDVEAVIAAEAVAERTRRAAARSGSEVPAQPIRDRREAGTPNPPVRIIESRNPVMPAQSVPAARPAAAAKLPAAPRPPVATGPAKVAKSGSRRPSWLAAVLVAAALGGGFGAWTLSGGDLPTSGSKVNLSGSALAARDWVNVNLDDKASVLAPASVASGLRSVGFDATRVIPYPDGSSVSGGKVPDWRCCNVFVATAPTGSDVRDSVPSALRNSYDRSRLMAKFSAGGLVTEVRQVLDGTPDEVKASLATEKAARKAAGKEIVGIERITLSRAAEADLLAGRVDSRVMLALVGLSTHVELSVESFPIDPADKAAGAPARGMRINFLEREGIEAGSAALAKVYDFLDVQVAPYRPMDVNLNDAAVEDGFPVLAINYDAPGALGLITPRE